MQDIVACHDCDLIHARRELPEGSSARCSRCGGVLYRNSGDVLDRCLALSLASLALLIVANAFPFLDFQIGSRVQGSLMSSGVMVLQDEGYALLALAVGITGILAPSLLILCLLWLVLPLRFGWRVPGMGAACRWVTHLKPWAMLEVYLLGVIVTFAKLSAMAKLTLGPGCLAFVMLIITVTAAVSAFDAQQFWRMLDRRAGMQRS